MSMTIHLNNNSRERPILVADDDDDDRLLTADALRECGCGSDIHWVENGKQLLDYILRRNGYTFLAGYPLPRLVLLDLNMPLKDGRQALVELKNCALSEPVPVVIFTTSRSEYDIEFTFRWGAHMYVPKPSRYRQLVDVTRSLLSLDVERRITDLRDFVFR